MCLSVENVITDEAVVFFLTDVAVDIENAVVTIVSETRQVRFEKAVYTCLFFNFSLSQQTSHPFLYLDRKVLVSFL